MKRTIGLLLTLAMALALCACGGGNPRSTEPAALETATAAPDPTDTPAEQAEAAGDTGEDAAGTAMPGGDTDLDAWTDIFVEILTEAGLADVRELYEINASENGGFDMIGFSIDKSYVSYVSDGKVKLDGVEFTLPISAEEYNAAGWYERDNNGQTLRYGYMTTGVLRNNEKGYSVSDRICNNVEGTEVTFDRAAVCGIEASPTSSWLKNPDIEICGGITVDSSIGDVVSRLGYPELVNCAIFYDFDDPSAIREVNMELNYTENGNAYNNVDFTFDYETGKMTEMSIEVSIN